MSRGDAVHTYIFCIVVSEEGFLVFFGFFYTVVQIKIFLIDFDRVSDHVGLFYADWLGNHIYMFTLFVLLKKGFFVYNLFEYKQFFNRSIWPTGSTTLDQSRFLWLLMRLQCMLFWEDSETF